MDASDEILHMPTPSALLNLDGSIHSLNEAMAWTLGRPVEQCVGRGFGDLLPASQLTWAERLVSHAAATETVVMRVLEFPGPGSAFVVLLVEARRVNAPAGGEALVWVHSLDARNDRGGLLIPFRLAAKDANLGVCMYSPLERKLEWLGGAPALEALFPDCSVSLSDVVRHVDPEDRIALRRLARSTSAWSPWGRLRFLTERDGWHHLICRTRRLILGFRGPVRIFGLIRDDTNR